MSTREMRFSPADQRAFARLSGDANPIHVDPAAARRTAVGEPVVHGMHALLRTLDRQFARLPSLATIAVRFERPIIVGDIVQVEPTGATEVALMLDGGLTLATVRVERANRSRRTADLLPGSTRPRALSTTPRVLTLQEVQGSEGVVSLKRSNAIARQFPRAARAWGAGGVAALAAISRLVGMECPGRDSMLSALSVVFDRSDPASDLRWRVSRVDRRFGLVRIEVSGGGLRGTVDAFVRPAPTAAASFESIAALVAPNEFSGQRALVVGGSRGLGATTAQLVSAGGGAVLATFAAGKNEAAALRRDAARAGASMDTMHFDIMRDPVKGLAAACKRFRPSHLYYFATPRIFGRRRDPFDAERFHAFAGFYVTGFASVCRAAMETADTLEVLYPSTTVLAGRPVRELTEYTAAKAAGEAIAASLSASIPRLRIAVRRLPRVTTDQTSTILPVSAADPAAVMLPILRELHRADRAQR